MKTWWKRLLIAFVIAWFLPEPNPDQYVPLVRAFIAHPRIDSLLWWETVAALVTLYTIVAFAFLSIVWFVSQRVVR